MTAEDIKRQNVNRNTFITYNNLEKALDTVDCNFLLNFMKKAQIREIK